MYHPNAKLTVRDRHELVLLVEDANLDFRAAAAAMRESVSTAYAWVVRWRAATPARAGEPLLSRGSPLAPVSLSATHRGV